MAVVVMALIVTVVHFVAHARLHDWPFELGQPAQQAAIAAIGGMMFYRFLRSLGRSRFSGFLAGTAYALAPWFTAITVLPREQCAAALAPLVLEAAIRSSRPDQSRLWLPWAGLLIALPFAAGVTTVACLAALLAVVQLGRATIEVEAEDRRGRIIGVVAALVTGTAATISFVALDLAAPWFGISVPPTSIEVIAAHRSPGLGLDVAAFIRLPGPVLLLFAVLGLLRWQRRASNIGWLSLGLMGAIPTILLASWPAFADLLRDTPELSSIAAASWWLTLLATTVLGASGLDDFLEMPQRRAFALRLLTVLALVSAPLLMLGAADPEREWPLVTAFLALTVLLCVWRRMGMLPFKNVLAVVALLAVAAPALQVLQLTARPMIGSLPAMPIGETSGPDWLTQRSLAYYSVLLGVLTWACFSAMRPRRRRSRAKPPPARARAPIA